MNKNFAIGFISGLATFSPSSGCADSIGRLGWPLQFYESGGFIHTRSFNVLYLVIDIGPGLLLAFLVDWIFSRRKEILPK